MSANLKVCDIDQEVIKRCEEIRRKKDKKNAALILKVDKEAKVVKIEEYMDDCTLDEVKGELSEHQPRYFIYSFRFEHKDGRVSFPLCAVHVSPEGCQPELTMMYSGSWRTFVGCTKMSKSFEIRDIEELTEEWLAQKLTIS